MSANGDQMTRQLERAMRLNFTPDEMKAFQIGLLYQTIHAQKVAAFRPESFSKRDPRKGEFFRHCMRIYREVAPRIGLRNWEDYKKFFCAQFDVLLKCKTRDGDPAYLSIKAMSSDSAVGRYHVWNKQFRRTVLALPAEKVNPAKPVDVVCKTISEDRKQMTALTKGVLTRAAVQALADRGTLLSMVANKVLSPYYALQSPVVRGVLERKGATLLTECRIDPSYYHRDLSEEAMSFFRREFAFEFQP